MDDIIGKNLKIFNSKESHNKNIEFLLILSINLKIKQIKNNIKGLKIIILIRKIFLPTINSSVLLKAFIKRMADK